MHLSGTLKTNAQVRTHLNPNDFHEQTGLRIELENLKGTTAHSITLVMPCTTYAEAEAKAKDMLKGRVIQFDARAEEAHVFFPAIHSIRVL